MPDDMYAPTLFPRNAGLDAMGSFNQAAQGLAPIIHAMRQKQIESQPLWKYLGATDPKVIANLPPGAGMPENMPQVPEKLKAFQDMPVGKFRQLAQIIGPTGVQSMMSSDLYWDPAKGTFGTGKPPAGATPISGAKPADMVRALKPPAPKAASPTAIGPDQVSKMADRIQGGDMAYLKNLSAFGSQTKNAVVSELANRGVDLSTISLDFEAKQAYTRTINSPGFQNTVKLLRSVGPNMDKVLELSNKIDRSQFKVLNKGQLGIMKQSGDTNVAAFSAASLEVADQIAKILAGGGTGSATSDAKLRQGMEILDGTFSADQLTAIVSTMKQLLRERESALTSNTMQTISSQGAPKMDPAKRFAQLEKKGMKKEEIYRQMHEEGY